MSDQANDLRRLMTESVRPDAPCAVDRPRWIIVAGGKGGVGTTTVALHLALADTKKRTLMVDADPQGGDVALRCELKDRHALGDLLVGHPLIDVVQQAPCGIRCVPGLRGWDAAENGSRASADRLLAAINNNIDTAGIDVVILDVGNRPNRTTCRLWRSADAAVMVANTEAAGIVGAFDAMKQMCDPDGKTPTLALINHAKTAQDAEDVFARLAYASRRFLGLALLNAGRLPVLQRSLLPWRPSTNGGTLQPLPDARLAFDACIAATRRPETAEISYQERTAIHSPTCGDLVCNQ